MRSEASAPGRSALPVPAPALRSVELSALDRQRGNALAHLVPSTLIAGRVNAAVEQLLENLR
jgi:hypothetical protein